MAQKTIVAQKKEPTREEMLSFIQQEQVVRPVTIDEIKYFIHTKYGNKKWVDFLFLNTMFEYEGSSHAALGGYDPKETKFTIPEYYIGYRRIDTHAEIRDHYQELQSESSDLINSGNFEQASNKLVKALYDTMHKQKEELESLGRKRDLIEAIDHEIGHFVLHKIREGNTSFNISYPEVEDYVIRKMRRKKDILTTIAQNYILSYAGEKEEKRRKMLEDEFFKPLQDPRSIHEKGDEIVKTLQKKYHEVVVTYVEIYKRKEPIKIPDSLWERLSQYLSENEIKKLKEEAKNVIDLDGKFGLTVRATASGSFEIGYSAEKRALMKEYGISNDDFTNLLALARKKSRRELLVDECFARLIDSLTDLRITDRNIPNKTIHIGVTGSDIEFFSSLTFGREELMFDKFIEQFRDKMKKSIPRKKVVR